MYFTPPYVLVVIGFFAGITSGLAFQETLKMLVRDWAADSANKTLRTLQQSLSLRVTFLGILLGVCLFLGAGVQLFGVPQLISYAIAAPLAVGTGALVWWQLGKILVMLEEGGSKALELDSMF